MTHTVTNAAEIAAIVGSLEVNDLIIHKGMEYAQVVFELQKAHPDIEAMYVHPGTDLYTLHGNNVTVILGGISSE